MGAEVGATTSIFHSIISRPNILIIQWKKRRADEAMKVIQHLRPDPEVIANPELYYDQLIEINLSELEPHVNGPFTPDAAYTISEFGEAVKKNGWPRRMEVGLIGSCTNSSYEDLTRAVSIVKQAAEDEVPVKAQFLINPGSEQIRYTAERDGILQVFEDAAPQSLQMLAVRVWDSGA